jgi:hypothetical protein
MLIEREEACLCLSARRQIAGPNGSGSPEVGLPAVRQAGAGRSPFRRRRRRETTMGAAQKSSTNLLTTSS